MILPDILNYVFLLIHSNNIRYTAYLCPVKITVSTPSQNRNWRGGQVVVSAHVGWEGGFVDKCVTCGEGSVTYP